MDKKELIALVRKYLNGKATPEERSFVESWYRNMDADQAIDSILTSAEITQMEQEIFQNIHHRIQKTPAAGVMSPVSGPAIRGQVRLLRRYAAIAASLLVVVTTAWLLYQRYGGGESSLTIVYSRPGKISKVTLSDGSLAWLNADSKLRFSKTFGPSGSREIFLEGEAYFEVAKDEQHPFLVHTKNLTTHVLGTKFNVKAYSTTQDIEVTLLEGRVMLSATLASSPGKGEDTLYLEPNQKALFTGNRLRAKESIATAVTRDSIGAVPNGAQRPSRQRSVTASLTREWTPYADESAAWRNGQLIFRGATLENVMGSLARKYNIRIQSAPSLIDSPVTAIIHNAFSPEDALLEITRQLRRSYKKGQPEYGDKVQFRKEGSVYYIE